jgi:hypothetical protein
VSKPEKPDLARGWRFVEKLLADEDAERLDQASDEDIERQMRAHGAREPSRVPSADELLAKAAARAAQRNAGAKQASGPTVRTRPVRPRRTQWVTWLAAAAIAGLVAAAVTRQRKPDMVSSPYPGDAGGEPQAPTAKEIAAQLRSDAFAACGAERWAECEGKLDEAKNVDPDGESDARVKETRTAVANAKRGVGGE